MVDSVSYRSTATAQRRQAILQAALQSFLTKGYTDTTMEDIRQLSGASTGSIYHHFENKETLALTLHVEGRNDLNAQLLEAFVNKQPEEGIKALISTYFDWMARHVDLGRFMIQANSIEYLGVEVHAIHQAAEVLPMRIYAWLSPFIETGLVARYPRELYIPLIFGPSRELVRLWLRDRREIDFSVISTSLANVAWQTLCAP
ncbi:transcriptional regulator [Dictyobacter alpinus]|uniref:Transcriptional regulator n=1 Tax=Dictyobacter alpinus TaxID=2014873 RepID=A0A402BAD4_9CHLR|nr:TetR/AcrR family transcriptional regulator [Dictyobacter alpinus]GCE28279.1 transcriptional regulator [Dictyobacter alpinus]